MGNSSYFRFDDDNKIISVTRVTDMIEMHLDDEESSF